LFSSSTAHLKTTTSFKTITHHTYNSLITTSHHQHSTLNIPNQHPTTPTPTLPHSNLNIPTFTMAATTFFTTGSLVNYGRSGYNK
jgi:hypothetical protein